jgi:hypothetical protein
MVFYRHSSSGLIVFICGDNEKQNEKRNLVHFTVFGEMYPLATNRPKLIKRARQRDETTFVGSGFQTVV